MPTSASSGLSSTKASTALSSPSSRRNVPNSAENAPGASWSTPSSIWFRPSIPNPIISAPDKRDAAARLFTQAYQQDGVLTNTEVALLLKLSPSTVGKYVAQWELERSQVLPRRGTIHDMGPSLTHKRIIIHKLFIDQHTVEQVARDTHHSFEAIQNYIGTFRQVLLCRKKNMTTDEIAFAIKRTPRLVKEYESIIEHYRQRNQTLNRLLDFQPKVK
jgi:predicted transcriptional regulator